MRYFAHAAILALLLGVASCQEEPKATCPNAKEIGCTAYATLDIKVTGGNCEGVASANCEAVGTSQSKYVESYKEWFGGDSADKASLCDSGKAEAAAEAIAEAVAEVWTSAQAQVKCEGYGTACGFAVTSGEAFGLAMSEALAQAAADASVADVADAFCFADVRAVSTALAEAAASASASACVQDSGTLEDWQEAYVRQVAQSIATAFARATASVCAEIKGEVTADSKCEGKAVSDTQSQKDQYADGEGAAGDACGGIAQLKACTGPGAKKCCDPDWTRALCTCRGCNGPWVKRSEKNDLKKVFEDKSSTRCFCEDTSDLGSEDAEDTSAQDEVVEEDPKVEEDTTGGDEVVEEDPKVEEDTTGGDEVVEEDPKVEEDTTGGDEVVESTTEDEEAVKEEEGVETDYVPTVLCTNSPDTTCSAYSTLTIKKLTAGSCEGVASANCDAYSAATNQFKEAFEEWWKDEESACDKGTAEATATAVAEAIATVWAEAAVKVSCEGQGYACGWAATNGQAWAGAFAEAVAQAAADASDPTGAADAFCFADVRATSVAIAEAAADAQTDVCTTGGTQEDYQNSFASTVTQAIATAFASAMAETCNSGDEVIASSKCQGKATSDVEKDEFKYGSACAGASQAKACTGSTFQECCGSGYRSRVCRCKDDCVGGAWTRAKDYDESNGTKRTWKSRTTTDTCFCDQ